MDWGGGEAVLLVKGKSYFSFSIFHLGSRCGRDVRAPGVGGLGFDVNWGLNGRERAREERARAPAFPVRVSP